MSTENDTKPQTASNPAVGSSEIVSLRLIFCGFPPRKVGIQLCIPTRRATYAAGITWHFPTATHVKINAHVWEYRIGPFIVGRKLAG